MKCGLIVFSSVALGVLTNASGEYYMQERVDNFWSWFNRQPSEERVVLDAAVFKEEDHPRENKGSEGGGRFTKKPETLAKEDAIDILDPNKKSKYRGLRDAQAQKVKGKGTFNLLTGEPITNRHSGFQVSFQEATTESPNYGAYISDEEYDRKVEAIKKELGSEPELGHWDEDEISFHCLSLEKALEVARRHNQQAIWNWETNESVPNEDFVGRTHWVDRDNHDGKRYHEHKVQEQK